MTNVPFPKNYFPHDDSKLEPLFAWRAHANLLWRNWLNWVYQTTPYDLTEVPQLRLRRSSVLIVRFGMSRAGRARMISSRSPTTDTE